MGKAVTKIETDADRLLQQAVDTLVVRWGQTKLAADSGAGVKGPLLADRAYFVNVIVKRAAAMRQRGSIALGSPATGVIAGTASN